MSDSNYIIDKDGKKTAIVNVIIDPQKGFHDPSLANKEGGNLYVPGGEDVVEPIGKLIKNTENGIFIISNDWHPANHFPVMTNHPGVMEYRKQKLKEMGESESEALNPLKLQFSELVLDKDGFILGLKEADGKIRKVEIETKDGQPPHASDIGRVTKVFDDYLPEKFEEITGARTQLLWTPHCVQGTDSAKMHEDLGLPSGLLQDLDGNLTKMNFHFKDVKTGNEFFVVRKGERSEVDSNGLVVENDKTSLTGAFPVFQDLAKKFQKDGVDKVVLNYMGLATNFCVEFSCNQVAALGAGLFSVAEMQVEHNLALEACRGIPIPGGKDDPFSLDGVLPRLEQKYGFKETSIEEILSKQKGAPTTQIAGNNLTAATGKQLERE